MIILINFQDFLLNIAYIKQNVLSPEIIDYICKRSEHASSRQDGFLENFKLTGVVLTVFLTSECAKEKVLRNPLPLKAFEASITNSKGTLRNYDGNGNGNLKKQ